MISHVPRGWSTGSVAARSVLVTMPWPRSMQWNHGFSRSTPARISSRVIFTISREAYVCRGQTRTVIPAKRTLDGPLGGDEEVEVVFTVMTHEFTFRVNVETLPDGTIVLGAAFDEASWSLMPEGLRRSADSVASWTYATNPGGVTPSSASSGPRSERFPNGPT